MDDRRPNYGDLQDNLRELGAQLEAAEARVAQEQEAWRTVWMESVPKKRSLAHASKSLDRIHGIARARLPGAGGSGD
jgi:hypothetical protein